MLSLFEEEEWDPIILSDLIAVAIFTLVTGLFVFVPPLDQTPIRPIFALIFLLFVPGYTIAVALIPQARRKSAENQAAGMTDTVLEYLVFAFGISVSLLILVALALGLRPGGINPVFIYSSLALITVTCLPIAAVRRFSVPPEDRTQPILWEVTRRTSSKFSTEQATPKLALNIALVIMLIITLVSAGAGFGEQRDADITEFYLLSENSDGEFVATDYPSSLTRGSPELFALGINNQEGETIEYTVIVLLQRFADRNGTEILVSETELQRVSSTVRNGETVQINISVTPKASGSNYRLTYLLYVGEPPSDPTVNNVYREVHLWVDIEDAP
ncbi:DUF1616 domain-containing protein [Haloarcula sp. NS06]|uniref:DUF1616 domain-containing protein n=1 Tax=Haloarcula sp. NS06 TaxID=3409688 RepID=UPI003DA6D8DB